ncbi:MAG: ATP-binding protein [Kiritimatiellae bacterium]|nr:ATP-binding protein [Kiritimatiellia bacterium]
MAQKIIGKVAALENNPSTIDHFCFWTDKNTLLNPFDVVVVEHVRGSKTYGVVEEISHITDSESFLGEYFSNDFGSLDVVPNTERVGMNFVLARVVKNTQNIYIPVQNGQRVSLGDRKDIEEALGLDEVKNKTVCGYLQMYEGVDGAEVDLPVYVNSDFLIGPEGAHLNISGISGLATKTSYAMFLLNALQQKYTADKAKKSVAYIFLNVKGRDLLTIDQPGQPLSDFDKAMYKDMGLEEKPFQNVRYFYPYGGRDTIKSYVRPEVFAAQCKAKRAKKFKFSFNEDKENLDLLFSNVDDPTQTMESIINFIVSEQKPFNSVDTWDSMLEAVQEMGEKGRPAASKEISVMSWRKFKRIVKKSISIDRMFTDEVRPEKDEVRLESAIRGIKPNEVFVVDVAKQDENMQAFVFGAVMQAVTRLKLGDFDEDMTAEERKQVPDRIVLFVDELNKYAASDAPKSSPILRLLLDIAERGRSLGIVLFSAEQFKSSIHKRVSGNCSTHAYGRTNSVEVSDKTYSFVPNTYKNMMTRLKQGHYIIQNPVFHSLLKVRFPMPLYKQDKGDN